MMEIDLPNCVFPMNFCPFDNLLDQKKREKERRSRSRVVRSRTSHNGKAPDLTTTFLVSLKPQSQLNNYVRWVTNRPHGFCQHKNARNNMKLKQKQKLRHFSVGSALPDPGYFHSSPGVLTFKFTSNRNPGRTDRQTHRDPQTNITRSNSCARKTVLYYG